MNIRVIDFIRELWEQAGEPSDFDPWLAAADPYVDSPDTGFDVNSKGVKYYLAQLSRAQAAISNWRKTGGHEVRFKRFIEKKIITVGLTNKTFNFRPYGVYGVSIPYGEFFADADYRDFEGSMIEIEAIKYPVIRVDDDPALAGGSYIFVFYEAVSFDTGLPTVEGDLYLNKFKIKTDGISYSDGFYCSVPTELVEILKLYDGPNGNRMKRPISKDSLYKMPANYGVPTQWYIIGDILYFDTYLQDPRYYMIEFYRVPTTLVANSQAELSALRFEIPDYFVEPLQAWVEWQQARKQQEWDKARAIKGDLKDLIESICSEYTLDFFRDETNGFYVQMEDDY